MTTLRTVLGSLALLALFCSASGCASSPPAPSMGITPVACAAGYDCGYGVSDYYYSYGTDYPYYPVVVVPVYPIALPPSPLPVKPPLPPAPPPPPPKMRPTPPFERPCPRGNKVCP